MDKKDIGFLLLSFYRSTQKGSMIPQRHQQRTGNKGGHPPDIGTASVGIQDFIGSLNRTVPGFISPQQQGVDGHSQQRRIADKPVKSHSSLS